MALDAIIRHKRREAATLEERTNLRPSTRSLVDALAADGISLVMECKKASPSRGVIREDFDAVTIAREYAPYASAISVLADARYFQGSPEFVRQVSEAVDLPVLYKDVVVDARQIQLARSVGADAVLLMLSVLDDRRFAHCLSLANRLDLDVVAEVHDENELARALAFPVEIIGINNRNLHTLETDRTTTERLAAMVPRDRLVLAESGYRDRNDIIAHRGMADGFLIGSSLVSAADVSRAAREMRFGRVKVCGVRREDAVRAVDRSGGTHVGFILSQNVESPRCVGLQRARDLVASAGSLTTVGVFVNDGSDYVQRCIDELGLDVAQFHDGRVIDVSGVEEVWEVRRVRQSDVESWTTGPARSSARRRTVFDTYDARRRGGTGRTFDWSCIEPATRADAVLAGGITPANVAEASVQGCYAIDLSSGVESRPGVKSAEKIRDLFDNIAALPARGGATDET